MARRVLSGQYVWTDVGASVDDIKLNSVFILYVTTPLTVPLSNNGISEAACRVASRYREAKFNVARYRPMFYSNTLI